jgi:hypothetical protein
MKIAATNSAGHLDQCRDHYIGFASLRGVSNL